jgi:hypothetical protein
MKFAMLGLAIVAAWAMATPVKAQAVIDDPGRCAQFYPNANCHNLGPGNPFTGAPAGGWRKGYAHMDHGRWHRAHRLHHHHMH